MLHRDMVHARQLIRSGVVLHLCYNIILIQDFSSFFQFPSSETGNILKGQVTRWIMNVVHCGTFEGTL